MIYFVFKNVAREEHTHAVCNSKKAFRQELGGTNGEVMTPQRLRRTITHLALLLLIPLLATTVRANAPHVNPITIWAGVGYTCNGAQARGAWYLRNNGSTDASYLVRGPDGAQIAANILSAAGKPGDV